MRNYTDVRIDGYMNETTASYRYELIDSTEGLRALRTRWNELLARQPQASLFSRWDWLITWWESFSQAEDRLAVVWVEKDGVPFALAPFFVRRSRYYGLSRRLLRFVGEGHSDRADILVSEPDATFYDGLFAFLRERVVWDVVYLREIPQESALLAWGRKLGSARLEEDSDCPYISFAAGQTVEAFRQTISKKLRREFSNLTNRLKKHGEYRFVHRLLSGPDDPALKQLRDIEQHSAKAARDIHLVFSPETNYAFQQHLLETFDDTVQPLLTALELNGEIISYLYGFIFGGAYHAYNMAFLPEYARLSPGKLTMQAAIEEAIQRGIEEFDFLRGASFFKSKWSKTSRSQVHLTLLRNDLVSRLHGWLIFTARPTIKLLLQRLKRAVALSKKR